ncbi:hypothetical protein HPB48_004427 [Haemaphysalis longicornis]|uniref:Uncharacterized protein n=1 Tax=Haemaphysalis longicornis TaxID=44386 RepID=A0A9J6FPF7_HAELO|nr:hypothetical protein HPB48_004427 [Haemaphysalis longicornis]
MESSHRPGPNIAIIGTPSQAAANNLATLTMLHLGGKVYEARAYQTSPHDSVRRVIHGIPVEADSDYLMEMACAHDATLIQARRMRQIQLSPPDFLGGKDYPDIFSSQEGSPAATPL